MTPSSPSPPLPLWVSSRSLPSDQLSTLDSAGDSLHSKQGCLGVFLEIQKSPVPFQLCHRKSDLPACDQRVLSTYVLLTLQPWLSLHIPQLCFLRETKEEAEQALRLEGFPHPGQLETETTTCSGFPGSLQQGCSSLRRGPVGPYKAHLCQEPCHS